MHRWAELGEDYAHMLDWAYVPPRRSKGTDVSMHVNRYHDRCFHHLIGNNPNSKPTKEWHSSKLRGIAVAPHHFKPCMRAALQRSKETSSVLSRYRCSREEGNAAGLTKIDQCPVRETDSDEDVFYLIPNNVNFADIEHEISEAQSNENIKLMATAAPAAKKKRRCSFEVDVGSVVSTGASSSTDSSVGRKRSSPTERDGKLLLRIFCSQISINGARPGSGE